MNICLRDKITESEYYLLEAWRDWYAWNNERTNTDRIRSIREILAEWENSNQELHTLLGGELKITKNFEFCKPESQLRDEIFAFIDNHAKCGRMEREGWKFVEEFHKWYDKAFPVHNRFWSPWGPDESLTPAQSRENDINIPIRNGLIELISTLTLANNTYNSSDFTIPLPSGKSYTVRNGCKPVRALAKIAEAFNLPYFEDFRICHSQVHNQKKIKGDLTLSIHPLDYWTMSDNECGWESCMNWRDYGGYRQGTVEMMNSPCVIVAYLSSAENMPIGNVGEWNNKKWRQLFIVHKDLILGIKAYPYSNDDLTNTAMKWIKELAENNLGWKYLTKEPEEWVQSKKFTNPNFPDDGEFKIGFYSNHMYTDVGCLKSHPIFIGEHLTRSFISQIPDIKVAFYDFNYSGAAQCMACGEIDPELCDDSYLCCVNCEDVFRCSECGEHIYQDECYRVGDSYLCHYCWEEHTQECSLCQNDDFNDNFMSVSIMPKLTKKTRKWAEKENKRSSWIEEKYKIAFPGIVIDMCNDCYCNFEQAFLKPGKKKFIYQNRYGGLMYGCYLEDLNEEGLDRLLGWSLRDDIENGITQKELIKKHLQFDAEWIYIQDDTKTST